MLRQPSRQERPHAFGGPFGAGRAEQNAGARHIQRIDARHLVTGDQVEHDLAADIGEAIGEVEIVETQAALAAYGAPAHRADKAEREMLHSVRHPVLQIAPKTFQHERAVQAWRLLIGRGTTDQEARGCIVQHDRLHRPQPCILAQIEDLLPAPLIQREEAACRLARHRHRRLGQSPQQPGHHRCCHIAQDVPVMVRKPCRVIVEAIAGGGDVPYGLHTGCMRQLQDQDRREPAIGEHRAPAREQAGAGTAAQHQRRLPRRQHQRGLAIDATDGIVVQEDVAFGFPDHATLTRPG